MLGLSDKCCDESGNHGTVSEVTRGGTSDGRATSSMCHGPQRLVCPTVVGLRIRRPQMESPLMSMGHKRMPVRTSILVNVDDVDVGKTDTTGLFC